MKKAVVLALAAIMVLGVAGAAFAGSGTYDNVPGANTVSSGPVTVSAKVNPKLTLTVVTPDGGGLLLDWASIDPSTPPASKTVNLTVDSNKAYTVTVASVFTNLTNAGITVNRALDVSTGTKGQSRAHVDTVSLAATSGSWWDVEPGTYTGSITYTVTQN